MESFEQFLKDLQAGSLEPFLKSEPIPDDNSGPVKVAVAKNFNEVVVDNDKDVFIEFYAPWCGHCKKLAPVWDELGEKVRNQERFLHLVSCHICERNCLVERMLIALQRTAFANKHDSYSSKMRMLKL